MRAVRAQGDRVHVTELPEPDAPSAESVRVYVKSAGICGSDMTMLERKMLEHTLGHEFAGCLEDGTPVAVQPTTPCGCELCDSGNYQLCSTCMGTTLGVWVDGGMADQVWVDPASLVPLPEGVDVADACLVEPLAVAIHGMNNAHLQAGQRVAIVGAGSVGLCAGAYARSYGCAADIAARHPAQQAAAEKLGLGCEPSGAYDLVIEAAGNNRALATAVELCRPSGELLLLGFDWDEVVLPGAAIALKELAIRASMTYGHTSSLRDVDAAARLLAQVPEIPEAILTHRFPLEEAPHAFEVARDRKAGAIKVVLEP